MKKSANIESRIVPIGFTLVLILIWQFIVGRGFIPKFILPSPLDIIKTLIEILPAIKTDILVTLKEAGLGFGIAIAFSIVLAVLMDSIRVVKRAVYPLLVVSQTVPIIALAPLFVIWFGFGMLPKVIVVVLVCFFPIVVSLLDGLDSIDKDEINLLRSMGATKFQIFKLAKFPASMVNFFSGLRIAATYSIMGAVIGEWLGGSEGLGVYMIRVKHSYALDKFFAVIVIIVVLSMLLFKVISLLQYITMPWDRERIK
jgi:ABC-type nitrate/sulfonate/bicarbonate transport system permease component